MIQKLSRHSKTGLTLSNSTMANNLCKPLNNGHLTDMSKSDMPFNDIFLCKKCYGNCNDSFEVIYQDFSYRFSDNSSDILKKSLKILSK